MNRKIKLVAKDKRRDGGVYSMQIEVNIATKGLTVGEVNSRIEGLRNEIFDVARIYFNVSQIKQ